MERVLTCPEISLENSSKRDQISINEMAGGKLGRDISVSFKS
jgi:hypothetical protein